MAYSRLLAEEVADAVLNDDFGLGEDSDSDCEDACCDIYGYLRHPIISRGDLVIESRMEVDSDTGSCEDDIEDDRMAVNISTLSVPSATLHSSEKMLIVLQDPRQNHQVWLEVWCSLKQLKLTSQAPRMLTTMN